MYINPVVRIHSNLADLGSIAKDLQERGFDVEKHGYAAMLLYYFCAGIDGHWNEEIRDWERFGTGKVSFYLFQAARILDRKVATIEDYLVNGVKLGLFRSYQRRGDLVTVYYASVHEIAAKYCLDSLGVIAEIRLSDLRHLKHWSTQMVAQHLQNASRHLAKEKLPSCETIAQPEDILCSPTHLKKPSRSKSPKAAKSRKPEGLESQNQWARNVVYRSEDRTFVDSHFTMFGVSQQRIADYQGRSLSTVHRRLNNNIRHWIGDDRIGTKRERGIEPLPQTQLVRFIQGGVKRSEFRTLKALDVDLDKQFWCASAIWESGPNIYERQFVIRSGKACRYWYKKYLEQGILKFPEPKAIDRMDIAGVTDLALSDPCIPTSCIDHN